MGTTRGQASAASAHSSSGRLRVVDIPVERIRPEEGLGRRRDRQGHRELCRSIEQFGVLTPITVRPAPGGEDEYLLIKGQGRTLACKVLGISTIPAVVVGEAWADTEKVQQFLVENVARLKLSAVDRALLISRARRQGEETADVARRFGVAPSTVRRLEAQLDGASDGEVAALRSGDLNLALHAVIGKHVTAPERADVVATVTPHGITAKELDFLLQALNWRALAALGPPARQQRMQLLSWACGQLASQPKGDPRQRIHQLALSLPMGLEDTSPDVQEAAR